MEQTQNFSAQTVKAVFYNFDLTELFSFSIAFDVPHDDMFNIFGHSASRGTLYEYYPVRAQQTGSANH